jgi:hypothetical protein
MRKMIANIMATTGISLVLLAVVATLFGGSVIFISSVFQSLFVSAIVHAGLALLQRLEPQHAALAFTLGLGYTIAAVLSFGAIFGWFSSTPVWILVLMSVVIYLAGLLLSIFRTRREADAINSLLRRREQAKEQNT